MRAQNKSKRAFTMVEMLAVISVMAVIVALTIPNGIFARATGEESIVRSQGASFEMAMANYSSRYGAFAARNWEAAYDAEPSVQNLFKLLQSAGAYPASASLRGVMDSLQGYTVTVPQKLTGKISIKRTEDGAQIYPNPNN